MQVRLCRAKGTGEIYAMKKLKKSEMLSRGQVTSLKSFANIAWLNCNVQLYVDAFIAATFIIS